MAKTLGQLSAAVIEQVERMYGSCDVDIIRFINSGQLELAVETSERKPATIAVVNGVGTLPTDCLFPSQVFKAGIAIPMVPSGSKDATQPVTTESWMIAEGKLKIVPAATGSYELAYVSMPTELVGDSDVPALSHADDFLIAYAIWKAVVAIKGVSEQASYWRQETERERLLWKKINEKGNSRPRFARYRSWV